RLPDSILEDSVNKPWRPVPAGRISSIETRRLLLATIPAVWIITIFLGGLKETSLIIGLTWMYNDLGGADENGIVRNVINALGFVVFSSGATRIASGHGQFSLNEAAYQWLAMQWAIITSTMQMQDFKDQKGDLARPGGRSTAPLVLGDWVARWTIAVPVLVWSVICPLFWAVDIYGYVVPLALGNFVAIRVILLRNVDADRSTWMLWAVWLVSLYMLPLVRDHSILF
ncbi:hypothetical protein MMC12_007185, partial [Toensbergia leucococca]|nr:hypothetical protein [Toensbergia leucococca]